MKKSYLLSPVLAFAVMLSAVFLSCTGSGGGASVNGAAAARSAASLADSIALCLEKGGECYGKGDYTNALEYYVKGLKYSETGHNSDSVARFYKNIGNIYCLFEDYERGNLYYRDGLKYSRSSGDTASSLACKAAYLSLKDSVYNMRQFDAAKHAQFLYEMDKVEKEIATLQTQKERFRRTAGVLLLVVAAVTVFLVVIYRQKRKLDVSYASLYSVNRKYVDNSENMKRRLADCAEALKAKDGEITRLRGELVDRDGDKAAASSKYQSSSLNDNQRQAIVEAITDAMENRMEFCSYDFSLDKLAELVGSNSKYVSQVINDTFNKNFCIFVNEYRINLACMRLADFAAYGNYTIRAIAESVGFTSYSTFNSVFRKFTGITPSIYQKMARREENMLVDG